MTDIFDQCRNFQEALNQYDPHVLIGSGNPECHDLSEKLHQYIHRIGEVESEIVSRMKENRELSSNVFDEVRSAVNKIQYYEYFESVINEIIDELNELNFRLKKHSGDEADDKNQNLEKLREYYTMNTEFTIHDQVATGTTEDIEIEEEGGDLELF